MRVLLFVFLVFISTQLSAAPKSVSYEVEGLQGEAEILVDKWGVPHIYANHHYDAFFVQGFNAARDRLWQIDLWRRRGLGQLSEILGPNFVEQDKASRLFLYRGSMFHEWLAYGSDAKQIATSFTNGINAYVQLVQDKAVTLPPEFELLDYQPAKWHPEDVVRIRSNGLWRNVINEVRRANVVCQHGKDIDAKRRKLEPPYELTIPEGLDPCDVPYDAVKLYALAQAPVDFSRATQFAARDGAPINFKQALAMLDDNIIDAGSNNWAVAPNKTTTGRPILANDPHRGHAVPSLRYIAHLVAPGLNVIGAGEPALPGISIGHNEKIAFGLTIFSIDQEDLVVYDTKNDKYQYQSEWHEMRAITEQIRVKGAPPVEQKLLFTRDGPVIFQNENKAFAVRAAWLEPGMAPYFGSVEYMRANNWREFLGALNRWGAPSENQVYADTEGNIGYKPAGLTPIRKNYDGLLPVPGNGAYEWHGFYDMDQLPEQYNPDNGFVATANAMSLPEGYPYLERIIGFEWADPWRIERIRESLSQKKKHSMQTSIDLQRDYLSIPARRILSQLDIEKLPALASQFFENWDYKLGRDSGAAALFEVWHMVYLMPTLFLDLSGLQNFEDIGSVDKQVVIEYFESLPAPERQKIASSTLRSTIIELSESLGGDPEQWRWGDLHQMKFKHPLHDFASGALKTELAIKPVARGGSADTPNSTRYRQDFSVASGGSWRMVVDVGNWDKAVMTNAPGQSGDPTNAHYDDMVEMWADEKHLPLLFSRKKVEANTSHIIRLKPVAHDRP